MEISIDRNNDYDANVMDKEEEGFLSPEEFGSESSVSTDDPEDVIMEKARNIQKKVIVENENKLDKEKEKKTAVLREQRPQSMPSYYLQDEEKLDEKDKVDRYKKKKKGLRAIAARARTLVGKGKTRSVDSPTSSVVVSESDESPSPKRTTTTSVFNEKSEVGRKSGNTFSNVVNIARKSVGGSRKLSFGGALHFNTHVHSTGAVCGQIGSGVLLEGWLRQKQRKGVMKGMKHWNERYFVLYSKYNEIRYYSDVVEAAWGPIPLGEIGAIPLRLIQRISTPSHPKYKGCRFDITCKSSWGTHYADDYVSSDEEGEDQKSAFKSRVYSFLANSPQTRVEWVSMLDSLLKRSANSPYPDSGNSSLKKTDSAFPLSSSGSKSTRKSKTMSKASNVVIVLGDDPVPVSIQLAIEFLDSSTPGIEEKQFYALEASSSQIKSSLRFLNPYTTNALLEKPDGVLEQYLDSVTAGSLVKKWLLEVEQPIIPFQMFDNFMAVAAYAEQDPYDLVQNLKALVHALPTRNFTQLETVVMHLAGVAQYSRENKLPPHVLGSIFGKMVLRARSDGVSSPEEQEDASIVMQHLISNAEEIF